MAAISCGGDNPKSLVFAVQPNVLSTDMTATLTIFFTPPGKDAKPPSEVKVRIDGSKQEIALTDIHVVEGHPNQVQATVTAGQLDAGAYDIVLGDGGALEAGLVEVASPDINVVQVNPPFGAPSADTAISVTTSGYQLTDTPTIYVSQNGVATQLRAVSFESATSLSAIVPANTLAAGDYDIIVTDPLDASGGHVGHLTAGFHVIGAPPKMFTVTPQTVEAATSTKLVVAGAGFANPTAWLQTCSAPAGVVAPATPFALSAPTNVTPTTLEVTIAGNTMAAGVACVLRIVDGTPVDPMLPCPASGVCLPYADFAAIASVVNSGNLGVFANAAPNVAPMQNARRALGAVSGRPSSEARFLYAVGGDGGAATMALNNVESTQLDPVGNMLGWTTQRNTMTKARTELATVRVGQFIYAIGGSDGVNALSSVERARILDPLDVPELPDLDLTPATTGVAAGTWVYKITGVRDPAYASDPGGETLTSDPLTVTLPALHGDDPLIKVTLTWPQLPDVVSYNVYRTPGPGQAASQVELIDNVPAGAAAMVTFEDTGAHSMGTTPLPIGALGKWHATNALTVERVGAAAVAAPGPSDATSETVYLYVAGGASSATFAAGSLQDSYEWAKITINKADGTQTVSSFTRPAASIGGGRAFLSAYTAGSTIKSSIPADKTYVYFGTGQSDETGNTKVSAMVVGAVTTASTSGDLGTLVNVAAANVSGAGYQAITGFLFTFGGFVSAGTIANTNAAALCPSNSCATGAAPTLTNWNNGGGGTPLVQRALLASVLEEPFIYILGGMTSAGPTASTERTVW
ncbi:MAG TPA: hypothetical protein VHN14_09350 [Kofleriaceae bacterium]|nr:hypothetical protein [Kofleriaceae bacterium]